MNEDRTLEVSTRLQIPLSLAQDLTMKQIEALYTLLVRPIQPLVDLANRGIASIRDRFRREDVSGGIGKEVPFIVLEHILKEEQVALNRISSNDMLTLITGISRYPGTKLINAQLFLLLLSCWSRDSFRTSDPLPDKKLEINKYSSAVLHGKGYYPEIMYVFDILRIRLPSVTNSSSIMRVVIREEFLDIMKRLGIQLSKGDLSKLLEVLSKGGVYNPSSDEISMTNLLHMLSIISDDATCRSLPVEPIKHSSLSDLSYHNSRVYSRILLKLKSNGNLIVDNLRNILSYKSTQEWVDKVSLRSALHSSGISLTESDISGLWAYLFEFETQKVVERVPFLTVKSLLLNRSNEERTSLNSMPEELPFRGGKRIFSQPKDPYPFAVDSGPSATQPYIVPRSATVQNQHTPFEAMGKSNLCQRISQRVKGLESEKYSRFIAEIASSNEKTFARTNISSILSRNNIKALHADCDEIWSEISQNINVPKPIAFLDWLGIDASEYESLIPSGACNNICSGSPGSIFNFVPRQETKEAPQENIKITNSNQNTEIDMADNLRIPRLNASETDQIKTVSKSQVDSFDSSNMMAALKVIDPVISVDSASENRYKQLAAIVKLQKNRANLAALFRKMLGKDGRLDDNGLSTQRLANALLQEPISLDLSLNDCSNLVLEMVNPEHNINTSFSSTPRVFFRDVLAFLDKQPSTETAVNRPTGDVLTYRNNFLRFSVKTKLLNSMDIQGDRLKLLSNVPRLKSKLKGHLMRGGNENSWDSSLPDYCSSQTFKEIMCSVDVMFDIEEVKYIHQQIQSKIDGSIGDFGFKFSDAIGFLCKILE